MNKNYQALISFVVIGFFVMILTGSLFYFSSKRSTNSTHQKIASTPAVDINDVTNWKTFKSQELGITFKYPPHTRIDDSSSETIVISDGKDFNDKENKCESCFYILVGKEQPTEPTLKANFEKYFPIDGDYVALNGVGSGMGGIKINSYKAFEVDGKPAVRMTGGPESQGIPAEILKNLDNSSLGFDEIYVQSNPQLIISIGNKRPTHIYQQKEDYFEKILNTFLFTD